jgi:hypothetical protein
MRFPGTLLVLMGLGCGGTASQVSTALIEYHRSGGIRGTDDRLVVNSNGTAALTRNGQRSAITVDSSVVNRLRRRLGQIDFGSLPSDTARGGGDMYQYVIKYQGHTVRGNDASLPPAVRPVIELLDRILSRAR